MDKIAEYKKVSYGMFCNDFIAQFGEKTDEELHEIYGGIKIPVRATSGSAGYDFFSPISFTLAPGDSIRIPTGIRVKMDEGWVLMIFPRSSLGFKYSLRLNNTVGIIDGDYYYAENEGHIHIKITNESHEEKLLSVEKGSGFAQGIFLPFGITHNDSAVGMRVGGFGSTDNRKQKLEQGVQTKEKKEQT